MIIDQLKNASSYFDISKNIGAALCYLRDTDLSKIEPGRYEIDGSNIYAMMQKYETKSKESGIWEAHRHYIDVQYIIKGTELIGYANIEYLKDGEYDDVKDMLPLYGDGVYFEVNAGTFVILMPQDAHMPGIAVSTTQSVEKIVLKVRV